MMRRFCGYLGSLLDSLVVLAALGIGGCADAPPSPENAGAAAIPPLWRLYEQSLKQARYIDLTHTISPDMPVWKGFGPSRFSPAADPATGKPYTYAGNGFEANAYTLSTDQFGTQLDPPAHWAPEFPSIDELPATYALRPLVVISIVDKVGKDPGYHLQVADIEAWEKERGVIPAGAVVMVRSGWSREWPDPALARREVFPGVSLDALKFLHEKRHILFHGHEPLDTDTTPNLEGEHWLMHHGYAQAEGVANLDQVAETGCLITTGYPKFQGGLGGYARFVAICPPDWKYGVRAGDVPEAPMRASPNALGWDEARGVRVRKP
jgi:kynurenine formamidase